MHLLTVLTKHFENVVARLHEGDITADDAVSELANVNPDSELGTRLTDLMTQVALLNLLDFYIGYERGSNIVKAYFNKETDKETLEKLVGALECTAPEEDEKPYTQVKLYRTELDPRALEFKWIVELNYVSLDFDATKELSDIPVAVDLQGEIETGKDKERDTGLPAGVDTETAPVEESVEDGDVDESLKEDRGAKNPQKEVRFITDLGSTMPVTDEKTNEIVMMLPRFAVWGDKGRDRAEVLEVSDDLKQLAFEHDVPDRRIGPIKAEKQNPLRSL